MRDRRWPQLRPPCLQCHAAPRGEGPKSELVVARLAADSALERSQHQQRVSAIKQWQRSPSGQQGRSRLARSPSAATNGGQVPASKTASRENHRSNSRGAGQTAALLPAPNASNIAGGAPAAAVQIVTAAAIKAATAARTKSMLAALELANKQRAAAAGIPWYTPRT